MSNILYKFVISIISLQAKFIFHYDFAYFFSLLHRLSTAIELTWELGSVWLADKYMTNKDSKAMSLQYAMCLVRYVISIFLTH